MPRPKHISSATNQALQPMVLNDTHLEAHADGRARPGLALLGGGHHGHLRTQVVLACTAEALDLPHLRSGSSQAAAR